MLFRSRVRVREREREREGQKDGYKGEGKEQTVNLRDEEGGTDRGKREVVWSLTNKGQFQLYPVPRFL